MKKGHSALLLLLLLAAAIGYGSYPAKKLPAHVVIDKLEVHKADRRLLAYSQGEVVKSYRISLGGNPRGHKRFEGDHRTPGGAYTINAKNARSGYHKNLGVSYPNAQDRATAKKLGKPPGGDIKLHGLRNGTGLVGRWHLLMDWTQGCLALTNAEIDELYAHTPIGTLIEIKP